ncbi:16S rRNA (adenine(1518)-N(6)/adenine(1519)-N(6))-dimethyltransferase RsmA [Helicobacter sp. 16-1353]|uniref:16S rRNA (adenine(1518)-N(6)/adenine(1519)-N(6))- dimethyltransferase RsmA n=1 Tax=Helicobacter sp. 16-1353 TaxID=2004996 RepID=UPI00215D58D6|nr:16S rRNA (adenine(1518)-N(6)/adenine(1519)-N(6))-dimethyltransferase RsmA [Helicobacter sp. 16-1353]
MKANKKFGQNFLKDELYLNKIIESMSNMLEEYKSENISLDIIEIGPGLGDLSVKILDCFSLVAYEIDRRLCKYLTNRFSTDKFKLYNKDVLSIEFNKNGWLHNKPYILVSNLPYYIATRIVLNALKDKMCKGMIVMTQKEVAYKFCADAQNNDFCAISVLTQSVSQKTTLIAIVPPNAFKPIPKVESAIFSIKKNDNEIKDGFETMVKEAFSYPRKKLIKNLSHIKNLDLIFKKLNIQNNARAHQITTIQYHQIFENLYQK